VQLFKDDTIAAGYQLKLIDMDFSILADRRAPWHGHAGYVGSPHYMSPEHVSGHVPLPASDIFTCGLILYELIAHGHPYLADDDEQYAEHIRAGNAPPPKLAGKMPAPANDEQVMEYLHRCLSPIPDKRPTAKEVNLTLNGRLSDYIAPPKAPVKPMPAPVAPISSLTGAPPPLASSRTIPPPIPATPRILELLSNERSLRLGITTEIGNSLCKQLSEDAQYVDGKQFTLEKENGDWYIIPNPAARNQTLLNGKALAAKTPLKENDIIAVGNEAKAVSKMPLKVRFT
jgi:serine/threonine protein kinase